ncbi:CS domain-containing protein [Pseudalkalibacillus berkeleyi]|uniref:CS domain-containing protein n=1 Tax=Pseudalkalibacillus berkeleyi TaxID=1069813 RepID=A0ABS9H6H6_9BACL|nr:CS domain-containing protein [Pseudalkalibacillus berkeleyi]MCF6139559.1 CS domain-containing protein [Pseudalkalibacillus berkeleyi]
MKKYLKNERGGGMLFIIVGMLLASIFISFMFFDFFNVYISKRVSQTSADAAALAAAKEAREVYEEEYTSMIKTELEGLRDLFDDEKAAGEEEEGEEGDPPPEEDSLLDSIIDEVNKSYKEATMPPNLRDWLEDPEVKVDPVEALKYFYDEDELSTVACSSVSNNMDRIRKAAEEYAKKNGADKNVMVKFDKKKFRIIVESEKKGTYVTAEDSLFDGIKADASATIKRPKKIDISCGGWWH